MIGKALILFLVAAELLPLSATDTTVDLFFCSLLREVISLQHTYIGIMRDDLRVDGVGIAFTEREVIDRIQQVGLAHSIVPDETVDLGGELQFSLSEIFIVDDGECL